MFNKMSQPFDYRKKRKEQETKLQSRAKFSEIIGPFETLAPFYRLTRNLMYAKGQGEFPNKSELFSDDDIASFERMFLRLNSL